MSTIYFSGYRSIFRAELTNVSDVELLHYDHGEVLERFTIANDGTLYFIQHGSYARTIYSTQLKAPSGQCKEHYKHKRNIHYIRARTINGSSRIYFSSETDSGQDAIYYLSDQNIPIEYYVINPSDIMLKDQCTGEDTWYHYSGDFAFAPDNTLFISNGNCVPCGLYEISNAGADHVNGNVTRIYHDSEEVIKKLASDANYIYCMQSHGRRILRLERNTHQIELMGDTGESVRDLCISSDSLLGQNLIYRLIATFISFLKKTWVVWGR